MPHSFNTDLVNLSLAHVLDFLSWKNNFLDFFTGSGISKLLGSLVKGFVSLLCNLFEGSFIT
jgi:hypothetical protein